MHPSPPSRRHLVLVGMMGAGKTTIGRQLARRLGWRFCDSDAEIEVRTGCSVREIFERDGEAAFRRLESEVLAQELGASTPTVVAAAGGVVLDPRNRRLLRQRGRVVWLRASPETLAARVRHGNHRPLLAGDPLSVLTRLETEREALYAEVADEIIDVDQRSPAEIVARILGRAR